MSELWQAEQVEAFNHSISGASEAADEHRFWKFQFRPDAQLVTFGWGAIHVLVLVVVSRWPPRCERLHDGQRR